MCTKHVAGLYHCICEHPAYEGGVTDGRPTLVCVFSSFVIVTCPLPCLPWLSGFRWLCFFLSAVVVVFALAVSCCFFTRRLLFVSSFIFPCFVILFSSSLTSFIFSSFSLRFRFRFRFFLCCGLFILSVPSHHLRGFGEGIQRGRAGSV